ncbi:MAG: hypothetical protein WCL71_12595 [Deltaproteobacteria bacterium]
MKKNVFLAGIVGFALLFGALVCHAEKWDKNDYGDVSIESSYYDVDSIKVQEKLVSWTEKYILTSAGSKFTTSEASKHPVCKQNITKKGAVTHYQLDYQIESKKFRGAAKRYYNKDNELLCTDKDTGTEFKTSWNKIVRGSPIQNAQYDLVTKYKVKFQ